MRTVKEEKQWRKRILVVLVFDDFDVKGCVIKVDKKVNETSSYLGELMCKFTINLSALEGRARLIAPRGFQLLLSLNWQRSQTIMLELCILWCLRSYMMMLEIHILTTQ